MPDISLRSLANYFDRMGWKYELAEPNMILTGIRPAIPFYYYEVPIEVELGKHWVYLRAFLQRQVRLQQQSAVHRFLSILNSQCHQVRFFLLNNCVVLQSDIAVVNCTIEAFAVALEAVCRHAYASGIETAILSTNPSVANLYEQVDDSSQSKQEQILAENGDSTLRFDISANRLPS